MKAQILYGIGNIRYTDVDKPSCRPGEAIVKVSCCGICGSDIPRIFKTGAHNMPIIPGHEFSGTVVECADDSSLIGKRVGIFPLIPCMECPQCKSRHYEMCEKYSYLGSRCDGGFAEYVAVPVWNLLPVPDEVTDEEAAMLEPMAVAVHSIRRSCIKSKNSFVAVCGLGTIGLLTALFLKDEGYTNVFCIGNKNIQKKMLLDMGYEEGHFFDVRFGDPVAFIMDRSGGRGADYYFECIGRSESYQQAVKCTAPFGTVMLVGNPASDMELNRDVYWRILRNQLTLLGTWNSSFYGKEIPSEDNADIKSRTGSSTQDDWRYVTERLVSMDFSPARLITHRFSLDELDKGLDIMRRKSDEYVKILIE